MRVWQSDVDRASPSTRRWRAGWFRREPQLCRTTRARTLATSELLPYDLSQPDEQPVRRNGLCSNNGVTGSVVIICCSPSIAEPPGVVGKSGVSQTRRRPSPERRLRDARGGMRCPRQFLRRMSVSQHRVRSRLEVCRWGMPGSPLFSMRDEGSGAPLDAPPRLRQAAGGERTDSSVRSRHAQPGTARASRARVR